MNRMLMTTFASAFAIATIVGASMAFAADNGGKNGNNDNNNNNNGQQNTTNGGKKSKDNKCAESSDANATNTKANCTTK